MARYSDPNQWSINGLVKLAELIETAISRSESQNDFSRNVGISPNTISNLQKNSVHRIMQLPTELTIGKLASYLTNPSTGQAFTPKELYDFCKGYTSVDGQQTLQEYVDAYLASNPPVSLDQIAKGMKVSKKELKRFISNPESFDSRPERKTLFLIRLSSAIGNPLYLAQLAGVDVAMN